MHTLSKGRIAEMMGCSIGDHRDPYVLLLVRLLVSTSPQSGDSPCAHHGMHIDLQGLVSTRRKS
jgi:hypothetical protein